MCFNFYEYILLLEIRGVCFSVGTLRKGQLLAVLVGRIELLRIMDGGPFSWTLTSALVQDPLHLYHS